MKVKFKLRETKTSPDIRKMPLVVILGPTASGKSALGVALAKKFNGEVVSADSRQIYRGLDVGTGKITPKEMRGIPHHLLNIADPRKQCTVAEYAKEARRAIAGIYKRGRIPFIVGGTGFYIDAVARGAIYPKVPPNRALRKILGKLAPATLLHRLQKLDPERSKTIDQKNPRRLIRALEIIKATKKSIAPIIIGAPYNTIFIAIRRDPQELRRRIQRAVVRHIDRGLLKETKHLIRSGISRKRLADLGIGYRSAVERVDGKISQAQLIEKYVAGDWRYAKRQMTWLRRYPDIHPVTTGNSVNSRRGKRWDQKSPVETTVFGPNSNGVHWIRNKTEAAGLIKNFVNRDQKAVPRKR